MKRTGKSASVWKIPCSPQSGSLSPVSLVCKGTQETQLSQGSLARQPKNAHLSKFKDSEKGRIFWKWIEFKQNTNDCTLDRLSNSRHSDGTNQIKLQSQSVTFIAEAEYSPKENDLTQVVQPRGTCPFSPSAVTGTLKISATTKVCLPTMMPIHQVLFVIRVLRLWSKRRKQENSSPLEHPGEHQNPWHSKGLMSLAVTWGNRWNLTWKNQLSLFLMQMILRAPPPLGLATNILWKTFKLQHNCQKEMFADKGSDIARKT